MERKTLRHLVSYHLNARRRPAHLDPSPYLCLHFPSCVNRSRSSACTSVSSGAETPCFPCQMDIRCPQEARNPASTYRTSIMYFPTSPTDPPSHWIVSNDVLVATGTGGIHRSAAVVWPQSSA
jgi:hypothetical protein